MRLMTKLALTSAALLLSGGVAMAGTYTVTETESYGPAGTSWFSKPITMQGATFENIGGTGTWTGVSVTVSEDLSGTVGATAGGNGEDDVTLALSNTAIASSSLFSTVVVLDTSNGVSFSLDPGDSATSGLITSSASLSAGSFDAATSPAFAGQWIVTATDTGGVVFPTGASGNGSESQSDSGEVIVQAVYTYANGDPPPPVPEPATMAVFASALLGLGMLRRRRG
jgi:hypothetical protein